MAPLADIIILSLAAFSGNIGVALTGFGMAIVYLFVWQIAVLSGYERNFKYAVFVQSIALFSAQPLLLKKAEIRQHASRRMLLYFIPITIISTPIGQITGDRVSTVMVETIGGVLVTFLAVFEMYQKRELFLSWFCKCFPEANKKKAGEILDETREREDFSLNDSSEGLYNDDPAGGEQFASVYTVDTLLGEGAYSIVKVGTRKRNGETVAVKIVTKAKLLESEEEKLKDEISFMKSFSHPNILRLHKVFEEPEHYFIVTEIMPGGDLLSRLNSVSFFQESTARDIAKNLLEAVKYMHNMKIAHRDLKPENVLLGADTDYATIKLADFGFAKKEASPDSFTTMCGTPAYVAPDILSGLPYGLKADMWSYGVIIFALLAGYQPFRGDSDDSVRHAIKKGDLQFDETNWKYITKEAKDCIASLLCLNSKNRLDSKATLAHPWFNMKLVPPLHIEENVPVFFMIGSQRSGSNWLRTMLDQREDLAGPHPPHIMRDFIQMIDKFGDLAHHDNLQTLVDHVCTFVERNQVPWTNLHGNAIVFQRMSIFETAMASSDRVLRNRFEAGNGLPLEKGMYLLCIFDAIMNFYTTMNGKRMWMCKSMGMSQFHDLLLEFYGAERLRYIYLVRDPRDVAMSFMKTPVGDCHYHAIISKWTKLQASALHVLEQCPSLVHKVHYEMILKDKENVVKGIYEFIGERRFGGVTRQASVMYMDATENLINTAKSGREAQKASGLSYQFQNLGRGPSFAVTQNQKWRDPVTGLQKDDLQLIESVSWEMMGKLGYECHLVGKTSKATDFSVEDIDHFAFLNKQAIHEMNEELKINNPGDFQRRRLQTEVLDFQPSIIDHKLWEPTVVNSGFLSRMDLLARVEDVRLECIGELTYPNGERNVFRAAAVTQRGYYPNDDAKPNQDAFKIIMDTDQSMAGHWFSVLDGHGPDGGQCSRFVSDKIPALLKVMKEENTSSGIKAALEHSHLDAHQQVIAEGHILTEQSGTTSTSLFLQHDGKLFISNVGDSSCILGSQNNGSTTTGTIATRLCHEHTPFRVEERDRVKRSGALIMTVAQKDGLEPLHESWNPTDPPPRIWSSDPNDKFPGCGFTRSIGDEIAHTLGVTARPEIFEYQVQKEDRVIILASDGVTEWMTKEECIDLVCRYPGQPGVAAKKLVAAASERWIEKSDYMDDITAIVLFFDHTDDDNFFRDPEDPQQLTIMMDELDGANGDEVVESFYLGFSACFWTLLAGGASGFLGGLCGIPGPAIILYFLHPPSPVTFTKKTQRATGACITLTNVAMRLVYYIINVTITRGDESYIRGQDWVLYVSVIVFSLVGVQAGSKLFEYMKDSKATISGILAILLFLCGVSLLLSSFAHV